MTLSKSDQKLLSLLIEERNKLTASPKAYRHQSSIDKLTRSIVGIRNTIVYQAMPERPVEVPLQHGKTVLMTKGQTITLCPF